MRAAPEKILSRLDKVRANGTSKWIACCPAHEDNGPSLAIKELSDGKILLHCFAGCSTLEVISTIGLSMKDLFPPSNSFDRKEWKRLKDREKYHSEMMVARIALADMETGKTISRSDARRAQTALKCIENLEGIYGGRP